MGEKTERAGERRRRELERERRREREKKKKEKRKMFRAVVFGATGATGRELVSELAHSESCTSVNAVTRREIKKEDFPKVFPNISPQGVNKVKIKVVDYG